MKDSREFLRSSGVVALKGIAGLFALSWMGAVLFPMTVAGLIVLVLSVMWLALMYRRKSTMWTTVLALGASGLAIFTANAFSIYQFSGPVYFFTCSAFNVSCTQVSHIKVYDRSVLIVPIWAPKARLFHSVLGRRNETYFPSVRSGGGRTILNAPLEEQAMLQAVPSGRPGRLAYLLPVNLPYSELSVRPGGNADELELSLSSQTGLIEGIEFDSALSNNTPGQFSISAVGDTGAEEWRRLVFSNETMRAIMIDPAASVVEELARESTRTGLIDDFVRYATIKLALSKGFYANAAGTSQRLFELRSAIHRADADGDFRIAADRPWNRAFIMQSLGTLRDLRHHHFGPAPERRRRLAKGTSLSVRSGRLPWQQEWEWLGDKGRSIWATADPGNRFGNAMMSRFFDGSVSGMDDFFTNLDQLEPPDRERLRAREIFNQSNAFEQVLVEWLAEAPDLKSRRIAVMSRVIMESTIQVATTVLSGGDPAQGAVMVNRVRAARAQLAINEARSRLLVDHAPTEFQRIQLLSRGSDSFDPLFALLEDAIICGPTPQDCERSARAYWEGYLRTVGSSSEVLSMMLESATEQDPSGRRFAGRLIRLLERVAPPMTTAEFDQAAAPVALLATMSDEAPVRNFLPQICAAGDRYSRRLISEPDSDQRIFLHEGAMLLAIACNRSWGDSHRLALARKGLDPGAWVLLIQERVSARLAASRLGSD